MTDRIMQIIYAFLGSAGFALIFNVRFKHLILASVGGALGWTIFLGLENVTPNLFVSCFISSAFIALYSEVMARLNKTPASVFFISGVVPLIPGRALFYTASYALKADWPLFREFGSLTLQYALGIACGLSVAWALWYMFQKIIDEFFLKRDKV